MSARQADEARRFTLLVDVFYDAKVKLIVSAAAPPDGLYPEGRLANEFQRTVSRLAEMQTREYLMAARQGRARARRRWSTSRPRPSRRRREQGVRQ